MKRSMPSALANRLDVLDEVPGGVGGDRGVGAGPAAAALVEQDGAEGTRIEVAAHGRRAAAAGAAVKDEDRNAFRIAALFDIDPMAVANIDHALIEGVDRRVKVFDCALLT